MRQRLTNWIVVAMMSLTFACFGQEIPQPYSLSASFSQATVRALAWVTEETIVGSICAAPQRCKLVEFDASGGQIRLIASGEDVSLQDPQLGNIVVPLQGDRIFFADQIYEIPKLNVIGGLNRNTIAISSADVRLAFADAHGFGLQDVEAKQSRVTTNGQLVASEGSVALLRWQDGTHQSTIKMVHLPEQKVVAVFSGKDCQAAAKGIGAGLFAIMHCGEADVVDSDGKVRYRLGQFVLGYDRVASDAAGSELLIVRLQRVVSSLQRAKEIGITVATFGIGAPDEDPNLAVIQVVRMSDGKTCMLRQVPFKEGSLGPAVAMRPGGQGVAIATGGQLEIAAVPSSCR